MSISAQLTSRYQELRARRAAEQARIRQARREQMVSAFTHLTGERPHQVRDDSISHEGMVFRFNEAWNALELQVRCPYCEFITWIVVRDLDTLAWITNDPYELAELLPPRHHDQKCLDRPARASSAHPLSNRTHDVAVTTITEH